MSEIKLLPCPFCGGEVQYHSWSHTMENFFNKNTIICPTCDFAMEDVSEIRLIKKWNTRKPMQEIVERMRKLDLDGLKMIEDDKHELIRKKEAIELVEEVGGMNEDRK